MKLIVCTNFAQPFHTGGAERIVQQITEYIASKGNLCTVFCQHGSYSAYHNGVKVVPVGSLNEQQFMELLISEAADHIMVYSDWFFMWPAILKNLEKINSDKSIALVGMNRMRSELPQHKASAELFRRNYKHFKVLAHAESYIDAKTCKDWGIPVRIIHNSVDMNEFVKSDFDFKSHYGINTERMLLCVSNFFPGKGQEFLTPIIAKLNKKRKDFTFVFISSTLAFQPGNRLREMITHQCRGLPVRFLNDIPRSHVVQSYFASDVFIFPSQQECGPIVLLEAMAAKRPWIALNVGHVADLKGGFCVDSALGPREMKKFDASVSLAFEKHIDELLSDKSLADSLGKDGYQNVLADYNWNEIREKYSDFFNSKKTWLG